MSCGLTDREVSHTTTLRQWMEGGESWGGISAQQNLGVGETEHKQIILCKTAIAYGIAALLRQAARSHHNSASPQTSLDGKGSIDNFAVRYKAPSTRSHPTWKDIEGVDMLSPRLSVNIIEPSFLQGESDGGDQDDEMGRYLEVEFPFAPETDEEAVFVNQSDENDRCHSFGVLLYELFLNCPPIYSEDDSNSEGQSESTTSRDIDSSLEKARKKIQLVDLRAVGDAEIRKTRVRRAKSYPALPMEEFAHLSEGVLPSNLSLVIHNLLDCGEDDNPENAYESLDSVINDLHLLLLDPGRFLFDNKTTYGNYGRMKLPFREHKLYGRENEMVLITEAFCRVSGGKTESLFIGGFSGSGKSRLVNGLTARVDVVGGYVLTHKFDPMTQERSIADIVGMFNDLCLLIRDKNSRQDLQVLENDLIQCFCSNLSVLSQILPNIKLLVSSPLIFSANEQERGIRMNVQSICFILQRFIRVVSSAAHPVVLFFDDLQWCDKSTLNVIESLLCDAIGSACVFFVGTYRSNEVADDHEIFVLEQRLKLFGMPTTMLSLEGLNPNDLNTMVSDALCTFPRISESLSNIIYQKTKGNPFYVLSFMRSLVDRGLLEYSINMRRWVWDEDNVNLMDITGNVLYLLSTKMSGLSSGIQSALKIAACFGVKIKVSVVETLITNQEHSDISDKLDQVVKEGFMVKCGTTEYKFVHDKVREAAYSLIPEEDKDQYHYSLGMSLYSLFKGKGEVVDDVLFCIADQIKHGIGKLVDKTPELGIEFSKFYELAGAKAVAFSDHVTSCSYLTSALSLLPPDHWKSHYDMSLRINLCLAKSCYSCGNIEKAQCILQEMTSQCHSIQDKLPGHALLATILISSNKFSEAYILCRDVLSQLGEDIPESLQPYQITKIVLATLQVAKSISNEKLLGMKEMDERLSISMGFYNLLGAAAFSAKSEMFPFIACSMTKLAMENGLCVYSMSGLVNFAAILGSSKISRKGVEIATRIGKAAISCSKKRYYASEQLPNHYVVYYGIIAPLTEPLQTCADMLRQGFDAGMSLGEPGIAFLNSIQHMRTAIIAGERLPILLEKLDYYLKMADAYKNVLARAFFSLYRDTILSLLTGSNEIPSSTDHSNNDLPTNKTDAKVLESIYIQRSIQAYWHGHKKRCQFYMEKFLHQGTFNFWNRDYIAFIHGLNSLELQKSQSTVNLKSVTKRSIKMLKTAASFSSWNFKNKVLLLEAEQFSLENQNDKAQASYAASINSARLSGFIHEQGLACELAGYHYKKNGNSSIACSFFDQAKQCYEVWGSQMKVDCVTRELSLLSYHAPTPGGPSLSSSS